MRAMTRRCRLSGSFRVAEVLTGGHLCPHPVELFAGGPCHRARAVADGVVEEFVTPAQEQIAQKGCGRATVFCTVPGPGSLAVKLLEPTVCAGRSSAGVRVVDDVVMDKCSCVKNLECTG